MTRLRELVAEARALFNADLYDYDHACAQVLVELRKSAGAEMLAQLVNHGPVYDGDVLSKSARDDLLRLGLASRAVVKGQEGYTVANYFGANVLRQGLAHEKRA